jgi:hypothetical protein
MNKKYIFEYVGGTKGDMVVRFLNGHEPNISFDCANRTEPQFLGCENWLKLMWSKDLTLERFEEVLSVNPYEYVPAHALWCCHPTTFEGTKNLSYPKYMDLLKKYNYEILSLKFEPKHYVTIYIERILKIWGSHNKICFENDKSPQKFSAIASAGSRSEREAMLNSSYSDRRRAGRACLKRAIRYGSPDDEMKMSPSEIFTIKYRRNKIFNELTKNRTLLHYEELFCSDSCPFPEHSHREDEWLMTVEQSWCDYNKNDYRKFEVPEGCE